MGQLRSNDLIMLAALILITGVLASSCARFPGSAASSGEDSMETQERSPPVSLYEGETFYPIVRGRRGAVVGGNSKQDGV